MGHACIFKFTEQLFPFSHFDSRFSFSHPHSTASMKVAALALLVAGVASASVRSEKASVKELSNLNEATIGEVAAALKLLSRERPHQSFLQNDLEEALGAKN